MMRMRQAARGALASTLLAAILGIISLTAAASTPLPVGGTALLNVSADPADYAYAPSAGASLLQNSSSLFSGTAGASTFEGILHWNVFSGDGNNPHGGLTFEYWFFTGSTDPTLTETLNGFAIAGWPSNLSIDAAVKGGGKEILPAMANRSADGNIVWTWEAPDTILAGGGGSAHLFLLTSATGFGSAPALIFGENSVAAMTTVAAIPEPEIYAMLGVGLGVMGWAARRRKRQAA